MKKIFSALLATTIYATPVLANPDNISGCFARRYDVAHLGKHPNQLVTGVVLWLHSTMPNEQLNAASARFQISMTNRGNENLFAQEGDLSWNDTGYKGQVECDGGGFTLSHNIMDISENGIRMEDCGGDKPNTFSLGSDDKSFSLMSVPLSVCTEFFGKIDWTKMGG